MNDTTIAQVSARATEVGGVAGFLGWLASINWLGLIGATVAVIGLIVSWYYKHKRDRREEAEHKARMEVLGK